MALSGIRRRDEAMLSAHSFGGYLKAASVHGRGRGKMVKLVRIAAFTALLSAPALGQTSAQDSIPDLRGTWKGQSESVVFGAGAHPHHRSGSHEGATRFTSQTFTMTIDQQDGRRFSGTFASDRHRETLVGVVSRSGTIFIVDDDGYNLATLFAPNRLEMCYLHLSAASRAASCTEFTKQ
jgi:hypothetical protein